MRLLITSVCAVTLLASAAGAQPSAKTCYDLWYARNAIFADAGHCFKTQDAISVFGRRCYPPYGQLSPGQRREMSAIEEEEYRRGCR